MVELIICREYRKKMSIGDMKFAIKKNYTFTAMDGELLVYQD